MEYLKQAEPRAEADITEVRQVVSQILSEVERVSDTANAIVAPIAASISDAEEIAGHAITARLRLGVKV